MIYETKWQKKSSEGVLLFSTHQGPVQRSIDGIRHERLTRCPHVEHQA